MKSAAKVGLLLIVFFVLFYGTYTVLGKNLLARKHKTLIIHMADAGGVVSGTKISMAGVEVGTVQRIKLLSPHSVEITATIHNDINVPIGTVALLPSSLVGFGDTDLALNAPAETTGYLGDPAVITGSKAGALDGILPGGGKDLYANVNESLKAVRKLLQDQGMQRQFKQLMVTANKTLEASQTSLAKFDMLASRADSLLASNQGNLNAMVRSMKGTLDQVHYTAETLANVIKSGKYQNGASTMLTKATKIEDQASQLLARLDKIAADPALEHDIKETVHNAAETSQKGPVIAENAKQITENMAVITEKSKKLPDTLNDVATKASTLEDKLSALIDKFNGVKAPNTSGLKDFRTELDLTRETNPGYWRTDLNIEYPLKDGYITFGVYDAFETNHLNLQLAKQFGAATFLRYGIYASKPAVGVDYSFTRKFSLRTDLWNINSPELDARLRYDFGGGVIGWAGADRIFSHTSPAIGIGVIR